MFSFKLRARIWKTMSEVDAVTNFKNKIYKSSPMPKYKGARSTSTSVLISCFVLWLSSERMISLILIGNYREMFFNKFVASTCSSSHTASHSEWMRYFLSQINNRWVAVNSSNMRTRGHFRRIHSMIVSGYCDTILHGQPGDTSRVSVLVALLYSLRKLRWIKCTAAWKTLANILAVRHIRNRTRSRCCWSRASVES